MAKTRVDRKKARGIPVDKTKARGILLDAFKNRKEVKDSLGNKIREVITGRHKTYRYILVTGLLSKATDARIDPLSIQAGDTSKGAYDARTIAHYVLVPFEREYLPDSLGNSNEPYLNKPARFPRLSSDNAVRQGNDRIILGKTIDILSAMDSQKKALRYLKSALAVMEEVSKEFNKKYEIDESGINANHVTQSVLDYIFRLADNPCEGETCPIIVSAMESIYLPESFEVIAHKVNESGSSSNEVGDIDIVNSHGEVITSIEVKDKDFTKEDVEHAILKFHQAGLERTLFIYGKKVNFDQTEVYQLAARYGRIGCYCAVISVLDYARLRLFAIDSIDLQSFAVKLLQEAKKIGAKDSTIEWIKLNIKSTEDD